MVAPHLPTADDGRNGPDKILSSRESARRLEEPLRQAIAAADNGGELVVDFAGVEGMAPSFLDEFLGVLDALGSGTRVRFSNHRGI